mmetsp:Transcript_92/g.200  ORF Transcript_92/g.200 Transcript_92/m.200 type:complete len:84 (-) Transcript_92:155-406(-)
MVNNRDGARDTRTIFVEQIVAGGRITIFTIQSGRIFSDPRAKELIAKVVNVCLVMLQFSQCKYWDVLVGIWLARRVGRHYSSH